MIKPAHPKKLNSSNKFTVLAHVDKSFVPAGLLNITETGSEITASQFAYGLRYINRPNALEVDPVSLSFTLDRSALRGQQLVPAEGLAIFGAVRDAMPDAWGRRVIESALNAPLNGLPETAYLRYPAAERVGALEFTQGSITESNKESNKAAIKTVTLHRLEYLKEAADRVEQGLPVPSQLEDIFVAGTSLGGMRPKATVVDENGVLWLAKFRAHGEKLDVPAIEAATLKLAADAGLHVSSVRTVEISGALGKQSVMLIKRFDRAGTSDDVQRIHMVSALTMLSCNEWQSRDKSYGEIADVIRRKAHPIAIANQCEELFGRMIFNILVHNDDDHLRNHAFLYETDATTHAAYWHLSPLYDVMPRATVATERFLHLGIGAQGRAATITNAMSIYARFGLTKATAEHIIDRIWRVVREWKQRFEGYGVAGSEIGKISTAFRHIDLLTN